MEHSHPDTLDARGAFGREHRPCCALCDAPATVTLGAAEADWIGVRADTVAVCDHCATDIATDLARVAADDADRADRDAAVLADALDESWRRWPHRGSAGLDTVLALRGHLARAERGEAAFVDGFVALAVAS